MRYNISAVALSNELRKVLGKFGGETAVPPWLIALKPPIVEVNQFACVAADSAELRAVFFEPAGLADREPARCIPAEARARVAL